MADDEESTDEPTSGEGSDIEPPLSEKPTTPKVEYPKVVGLLMAVSLFEHFTVSLNIYAANHFLTNAETEAKLDRINQILFFFSTFIGAYVGDGLWGNYRAIQYMFPLCIIVNILILVSFLKMQFYFIIFSTFAMSVVFGSIENCFITLGGDQFVLPDQKKQLSNYFLWYHFFRDTGQALGGLTFIGIETVFKCPSGIPCTQAPILSMITMAITYIAFLFGIRAYKKRFPREETKFRPLRLISSFFYALKYKWKCIHKEKKYNHYMDHSIEKYGVVTVSQVKDILYISELFLGLILFWTLRNQQNETWPQIAAKTDVPYRSFLLNPERVKYFGNFAVMFWVLAFRYKLNQIFYNMHMRFPLQYMICGGFLCCLAFMLSATLGFAIDAAAPAAEFEEGYGELTIYNPTHCRFYMRCSDLSFEPVPIPPMDIARFKKVSIDVEKWVNFTLFSVCNESFPNKGMFNLTERKATGYFFRKDQLVYFEDNVFQSDKPLFRLLSNAELTTTERLVLSQVGESDISLNITNITQHTGRLGKYRVGPNDTFDLYTGEVEVLLYNKLHPVAPQFNAILITHAYSISIFYILPQYFVSAAGEVMMLFSGLKFAYIEAPESMKTTFESLWYMTTGMGIMLQWPLDVIQVFSKPEQNLVFSSLLLLISVLLLGIMSARYDYVDNSMYIYDR